MGLLHGAQLAIRTKLKFNHDEPSVRHHEGRKTGTLALPLQLTRNLKGDYPSS
jgi:hypothetical protein